MSLLIYWCDLYVISAICVTVQWCLKKSLIIINLVAGLDHRKTLAEEGTCDLSHPIMVMGTSRCLMWS